MTVFNDAELGWVSEVYCPQSIKGSQIKSLSVGVSTKSDFAQLIE
jgi:hypothetical protein